MNNKRQKQGKLKTSLDKLNKEDIFSMIFFALYKIKDIPEYSTLSELSYILDNEAIFDFLEYYGGKTIKIPTLDEFNLIMNTLLLYNYVRLENIEFEEALKLLDKKEYKLKEIKDCYIKISDLLNKYDFSRK